MEMYDGEPVAVAMVRIVFEDLREFVQFENLAACRGMGRDWPIQMLREYFTSLEPSEESRVYSTPSEGSFVYSLPLVSRPVE
jgi:hypothetical protein